MRRWFHLEFTSGYGLSEAEEICEKVIKNSRFGPRFKSEFWSKLGSCLFVRSNSVIGVSRDKGIEFLRRSVTAYMEAIWVGRQIKDMDISDTFVWIEKPLQRFGLSLRGDAAGYFVLFEDLVDRRHDVDADGTTLIFEHLAKFPIPANHEAQARLKGLCMKAVSKINRLMRPLPNYPGFASVVETLQTLADHFGGRSN